MKKILLGLGTLGAIVAPIASVVACGFNDWISIDSKAYGKVSLIGREGMVTHHLETYL